MVDFLVQNKDSIALFLFVCDCNKFAWQERTFTNSDCSNLNFDWLANEKSEASCLPVPDGRQCKYETEQCGSVMCNHAVGGNCNPRQRKYLMTFP